MLGAGELSRVRDAFDQAAREKALEELPNHSDCFIELVEHPVLFPLVHRIMSDGVQLRSLAGIRERRFVGQRALHIRRSRGLA